MINLLNLTEQGLNANTAVELRKAGAELGIKGASKGKKADLIAAIMAMVEQAKEAEAAKQAASAPKKGICEDCGRKVGKSGHPTLCEVCLDYAGWENTHSDMGHEGLKNGGADADEFGGADALAEAVESMTLCPVCHPELDPRTAKKAGRSRAGMVIVAKGSEVHKSDTFKAAAESAGWTVTILVETYELADDAEGKGTRHYATATRGDNSISLAWDGRAYDYPASSAHLNGKDRKVRNLKEALRLLSSK